MTKPKERARCVVAELNDALSAAFAAERARCLAVANDVLTRGPGMPCSSEFADGYSLAAQEIAAGIGGVK